MTLRADGWHVATPWVVAPSAIHGRGIICTAPVATGESVGISHWMTSRGWYTTHDLGRYHNHSSEPTCRNVTDGAYRYLVALRALRPGDEVTVDYRLQPDLEQPRVGWR